MASLEFFSKKADGTIAKKIASAPVGAIFAWAKETPPEHCLECNGATLTIAAYPELGAVLAESGATSFTLPDLRGEFVRGWDHGRGADSGRSLGSCQAEGFKSHVHLASAIYGGGATPVIDNALSSYAVTYYDHDTKSQTHETGINAGASTLEAGGTETRPRNVALMYVIVYE